MLPPKSLLSGASIMVGSSIKDTCVGIQWKFVEFFWIFSCRGIERNRTHSSSRYVSSLFVHQNGIQFSGLMRIRQRIEQKSFVRIFISLSGFECVFVCVRRSCIAKITHDWLVLAVNFASVPLHNLHV